MDNEDCEELDPGSGSIHSAGSLSLSQHPQTKAAVNRIQLNSRSGQKIGSGSEKVLPPNSLNLTSTISKYGYLKLTYPLHDLIMLMYLSISYLSSNYYFQKIHEVIHSTVELTSISHPVFEVVIWKTHFKIKA